MDAETAFRICFFIAVIICVPSMVINYKKTAIKLKKLKNNIKEKIKEKINKDGP